jgi:lipopolysaccharide export system protein LptA
MACKFHADMIAYHFTSLLRTGRWVGAVLLAGAACLPALADKTDRNKPLTIDADKPGSVDLLKQVATFNGNVVIQQGTMAIRAERAEVREGADGYRSATAIGSPGKAASFRQKRDALDEFIEGHADRIEYDGRGDVVRFIGNASVKRLRGSTTADEITGNLITYDSTTEVFSVAGAAPSAAAAASGPGNGRVRVVLTPRTAAASEPAAASAPGGKP